MASGDLDETERVELERLRRQVAELRGRDGSAGGPAGSPPRRRMRTVAAVVLVILATLLTPVAVVARYLLVEVLDTDRYVATVAPLARNPAVQELIADQVTEQVFAHLDVEDLLEVALEELADRGVPDAVTGLARPIANQVEAFVHDHVVQFVATDEFADLWAQANRVAHDELDAALIGDTRGPVGVDKGHVTLDLGIVVERLRQRLLDRGFGLAENIPDVDYELSILRSDSLATAQDGVRWLDRAATILPLACIAFFAIAVLIAPNRRGTLLLAGVGVAAVMVLLGVTLALLRAWYLEHGSPEVMTPEAAISVAQTVLAPLRTSMRAVLALGLVVTGGVLVTGPSSVARTIRTSVTRAISAVGERWQRDRQPTPAEAWIGARKNPLRLAIAAVGILALASWHYPSGAVVLTITLAVLAGMLVVELLGRQGAAGRAPGNNAPSPP